MINCRDEDCNFEVILWTSSRYVASFCHSLTNSWSNKFSLSNSSHMCGILLNTFIKHLITILSQDLQLCLDQVNIVICLYDVCWCCLQHYTQWFCKSKSVWTDIQSNNKCWICDALYALYVPKYHQKLGCQANGGAQVWKTINVGSVMLFMLFMFQNIIKN